jgi:peptidyl-dipeptidase Dcp
MKNQTTLFQSVYFFLFILLFVMVACTPSANNGDAISLEKSDVNPLVQIWDARYNGIPAFDKVKVSDFLPAEEIAISQHRKELKAIATNTGEVWHYA